MAAVAGVVTQFFINMEIERYTLATGKTALTPQAPPPGGACVIPPRSWRAGS